VQKNNHEQNGIISMQSLISQN